MSPTSSAWQSATTAPAFAPADVLAAAHRVRETSHLVADAERGIGVALGGDVVPAAATNGVPHWPLLASLPPVYPEWLGDRSFGQVHGVRFPYVSGAMANGIATTAQLTAMDTIHALAPGMSFSRRPPMGAPYSRPRAPLGTAVQNTTGGVCAKLAASPAADSTTRIQRRLMLSRGRPAPVRVRRRSSRRWSRL